MPPAPAAAVILGPAVSRLLADVPISLDAVRLIVPLVPVVVKVPGVPAVPSVMFATPEMAMFPEVVRFPSKSSVPPLMNETFAVPAARDEIVSVPSVRENDSAVMLDIGPETVVELFPVHCAVMAFDVSVIGPEVSRTV